MFESWKCAAAAVAWVMVVAAASGALAEDSKVVAKVNGAVITEKDVALAEAEIGAQLSRVPQNARRRVLIEFLIENQLIAEAANTAKLGETPAFSERLAYWKRRSLREAYFESQILAKVTDADLRKFYDDNIKPSAAGDEIRASHILVKTEDKAKEVYEALVHDGDFAELAKKNSEDPGSRERGGDLGYFARGMMVPAFEKAAFALKKDEISQPVKSRFGWHIIKVIDRRKKAPPAFDSVKDRLRIVVVRERVKSIVDGLRKSAKLEYVDPAIRKQVESEANSTNKKQ
ncbi:MAG: peptidylprolyl isomerase [Pseudomonadota bacterium]